MFLYSNSFGLAVLQNVVGLAGNQPRSWSPPIVAQGLGNVRWSVAGRWEVTAVTFFLSFRAWLTKILHCQYPNPELRQRTRRRDDKHVLDTAHTNNNTVTSTGGWRKGQIRSFGVKTEAAMTANMPARLSPQSL